MVCSFSVKSTEKKKLADGSVYCSATHAKPVHDVTEADCQTQNGGTHGSVFLQFSSVKFYKLDGKLTEKLF